MSQFLKFILTWWYVFLHFKNIPYVCIFIIFCVFIFNVHFVFLQATIFKVFGALSCLMVSYWYDQVACVFEKCNNLLDSKSIFKICDFKFFPIMLLRQLNFGELSVSKLFCIYCKGKTSFCFSVVFIVAWRNRIEYWTLLSNLPSNG